MNPLSRGILEFFNTPLSEEPELRKYLEERLRNVVKPCWELKFCPYGPLVEDYPGPAPTLDEWKRSRMYFEKCVETGGMGENHDIPIDEERMKFFKEALANDDNSYCVSKLSRFEKESGCKVFGHICPAYFVSEPYTETESERNRSRHISNGTIIRVARRDNNTCQLCGKILLDRDIEIDHIIPYSRGGSSDESNLRVTCLECNRRKGKKIEI